MSNSEEEIESLVDCMGTPIHKSKDNSESISSQNSLKQKNENILIANISNRKKIRKKNKTVMRKKSNSQLVQDLNLKKSEIKNETDFFTGDLKIVDEDTKEKNIQNHEKLFVSFSEEIIFRPSRSMLPITSKIDTEEPRRLSEEGLYVDELPKISNHDLNLLEQRLLYEGGKKWFNCQGNMKISKACIKNRSLRPLTSHPGIKIKNYLEFVSPGSSFEQLTEIKIEKEAFIEVQIESLKFHHHPLFSMQHVLQNQLINYYTKYKKQEECKRIDRITKRLQCLRNTKLNLENCLDDGDRDRVQETIKIVLEIKKLREELFNELTERKNTVKKILETWKNLKDVRKIDRFISTPIKLIIKKEKTNYIDDVHQLKEEIKLINEEISFENKIIKNTSESSDESEDSNEHLDIIEKKVKNCFRVPGEPVLQFVIVFDESIITKTVENRNEKLRRNAVENTKIYLKIYFNKMEVCKSKAVQLNDSFNCEFDEMFLIKTAKFSEAVQVHIFEKTSNTNKKKIGEVDLIASNSESMFFADKIKINFIEAMTQKQYGVGIGNLQKTCETYNLTLVDEFYTSGSIYYKIELNTNESEIFPINESLDVDDSNTNNLFSKISDDPQDPRFANAYNLSEVNVENMIQSETFDSCFHYSSYLSPLFFCKFDEIMNNKRLKMLNLRDNNVPEFYGLTVPLNEKEVPKYLLTDYENRKMSEDLSKLLDGDTNITKREGTKVLRQIYFDIFQKCRTTKKILLYDDIVDEKCIRKIENFLKKIIYWVMNWLTLNSSFNFPLYKNLNFKIPSKKRAILEVKTPLQITVLIKSAINVPKKTKNPMYKFNDNSTDDVSKLFVVLKYKNMSVESKIISNHNNTWNETLKLELESLNVDFLSPDFLNGSISLHLFDVIEKKSSNTSDKIWLGSTEINISSIYFNEMLDGLFPLQTPVFLFGYEQESKDNLCLTPAALSLSVCAQPCLPQLYPSLEELESNETQRLHNYIIKWNENFNKSFPDRKFFALAVDIHGKTTCVTRYITPIQPPQLNKNTFNVTPEQLANFFSMFSFTNCNKFYQNIWLTTKQFLRMMTGSVIDHAVALTCTLLWLNIQVWLLLGFGMPHGFTAYVLVKEHLNNSHLPTYFIYDVSSGRKYSIFDKNLPLQKVYCLINNENVWANIQRSDVIQATQWDLTRTSDWLPLFIDELMQPTTSVQQKVVYSLTMDTHNLEKKLENKIHHYISKLRNPEKSLVHNATLSKVFKKILNSMDSSNFSNEINLETVKYIMKIQLSYELKGVLVHRPYNSRLFEFIKNIDFLNQSTQSEYSLAIQLVSLPNQIISLWLLIGVTC